MSLDGSGLYFVHDADLVLVNLDPIDEQAQKRPAGGEVGLIQSVAHLLAEDLEVVENHSQLIGVGRIALTLGPAPLLTDQPFFRPLNARFELRFVQPAIFVRVDEATNAPLQLSNR